MKTIDPKLFRFRVLTEWDSEYNVWVARCLETGSTATADDPETVIEIMKELLEDEITFAWDNDNLANLFSTPAPRDIHLQWLLALKAGAEVTTEKLDLKLKEPIEDGKADLAEVDVAQAA